jgi:predicted flap endonuclease-1-like 5' DNA nuclease
MISENIKVEILKGLCGNGFGYIAGQVVAIPEDQAIDFIDKGWAKVDASNTKQEEDSFEAKADTPEVQVHDAADELPESMPCKDLLIAEGLETLAQIAAFDDLTKIKGIGKKTAEQILEYID